MNETVEFSELSLWLEEKLKERGVLTNKGFLVTSWKEKLPGELEEMLDGLIESPAELDGLLRIGQAVRRGEPLSPPVINAARLMVEEVCQALYGSDEQPGRTTIH